MGIFHCYVCLPEGNIHLILWDGETKIHSSCVESCVETSGWMSCVEITGVLIMYGDFEGIPGKQASIVWVVSFLWATILDNMEHKRKNIDKCLLILKPCHKTMWLFPKIGIPQNG